MNAHIVGRASLNSPATAFRGGMEYAESRSEYRRMKVAREHLDGCPIVESWDNQRGFIERYIILAESTKPEPQHSDAAKSQPKKSKKT